MRAAHEMAGEETEKDEEDTSARKRGREQQGQAPKAGLSEEQAIDRVEESPGTRMMRQLLQEPKARERMNRILVQEVERKSEGEKRGGVLATSELREAAGPTEHHRKQEEGGAPQPAGVHTPL